MNTHDILQSAAEFNARHDYNLEAVMRFAAVAARHAHLVQLARMETVNPQLVLPMDFAQDTLP
jgi:hypothetical protein